MATHQINIAAPRTGDVDPRYLRNSASPSSNREMFKWLFMRISGPILLVLIFVHLFVNMMVGDGVHGLNFGFVAGKWASPLWQIWDLTMLWLAMIHGTFGMGTIIDDYTRKDRTRVGFKVALYLASVAIVVLGTLVIFTFEPCMTDAAGNLMDNSPSFCFNQ
ncbi:MAG TPA: succinate dehydrogenase hydrophobic membrane anchor subunit [Candidatus Yaniella excrementigallinarum]|nr:succinate dehydrogenase hydrophobic membrane anchor subunit [Candidatus Yaniella excrementigallinarum]